jgi:hypothetical protein
LYQDQNTSQQQPEQTDTKEQLKAVKGSKIKIAISLIIGVSIAGAIVFYLPSILNLQSTVIVSGNITVDLPDTRTTTQTIEPFITKATGFTGTVNTTWEIDPDAQGPIPSESFAKLMVPFSNPISDLSRNNYAYLTTPPSIPLLLTAQGATITTNGNTLSNGVVNCKIGVCMESPSITSRTSLLSQENLFNISRDFTLSTWVKLNTAENIFRVPIHLQGASNGTDNGGINVIIRDLDNKLQMYIGFGGTSNNSLSATPPAGTRFIETGEWAHIAAVRGNEFAKLYINGIERASKNIGTNNVYFAGADKSNHIGAIKNGSLDDTMILNRAVSAEQIMEFCNAGEADGSCSNGIDQTTQGSGEIHISQNFTAPGQRWTLTATPIDNTGATLASIGPLFTTVTSPLSLNNNGTTIPRNQDITSNIQTLLAQNTTAILNWQVDVNDGNGFQNIGALNMPFDSTTNNLPSNYANPSAPIPVDPISTGTPLTGNACKTSPCYQFNPTNQESILLGSGTNFLNLQRNFTISTWINHNNPSPSTETTILALGSRQSSAAANNYGVRLTLSGTNQPHLFVGQAQNNSNAPTSQNSFAETIIPTNTWTHIAVTRENNVVRFYVNGQPDTINQNLSAGNLIWSTNDFTAYSIGGWRTSPNTTTIQTVNGSIDDVLILNRPVSPETIRLIFDNGQNNTAPLSSLPAQELKAYESWRKQALDLHQDTARADASSLKQSQPISITSTPLISFLQQGNSIELINTSVNLKASVINLDPPGTPIINWKRDPDGNGPRPEDYLTRIFIPANNGAIRNFSGEGRYINLQAVSTETPAVEQALLLTGAECQVGSCFSFNGTNQFLLIADDPIDANVYVNNRPTIINLQNRFNLTNAITASVWVNFGQGGSRQTVLDLEHTESAGTSNNNTGFGIYRKADNTIEAVFGIGQSDTARKTIATITPLTLNRWHHIAVTRYLNTARIYVDGNLSASTRSIYPQDFRWIASGRTGVNPAETVAYNIGRRTHGNIDQTNLTNTISHSSYYNGKIDEVMVLAEVLSEQQLLHLYRAQLNRKSGTDILHATGTNADETWSAEISEEDPNGNIVSTTPTTNSAQITNQSTTLTTALNAAINEFTDLSIQTDNLHKRTAGITWKVKPQGSQVFQNDMHVNASFDNTLNDYAGFNGRVSLANDADFSEDAQIGSSLFLDGDGDWANFNLPQSTYQQISISIWVKVPDATKNNARTDNTHQALVMIPNGNGTAEDELFLFIANTGQIKINLNNTTTHTADHTTIPANTWTHIGFTYNGSIIRVFKNGVETDNFPQTGELFFEAPNGERCQGYLGVDVKQDCSTSLNSPSYMQGQLDEFMLWPKAISSHQMNLIYEENARGESAPKTRSAFETQAGEEISVTITPISGTGTPRTERILANNFNITNAPGNAFLQNQSTFFVLPSADITATVLNTAPNSTMGIQWRKEVGSQAENLLFANFTFDNNTLDTSGENNHAAAWESTGFEPDRGNCKIGGCMELIQRTDRKNYLTFPVPSTTNEFTASFWVKTGPNPPGFKTLLSIPNQNGFPETQIAVTPSYNIFARLNGADVNDATNTQPGGTYEATSNEALQPNTWAQVAISFDGTVLKIYLNGEEKGSFTGSPNTTLDYGSCNGSIGKMMGGTSCTGDLSRYFDGSIDEMHFFNKELSQEQIQSIYNQEEQGNNGLFTLHNTTTANSIPPDETWTFFAHPIDQRGVTGTPIPSFNSVTVSNNIVIPSLNFTTQLNPEPENNRTIIINTETANQQLSNNNITFTIRITGTATAGIDYAYQAPIGGHLIHANSTTPTNPIEIEIIEDTENEEDETIIIEFQNLTNAQPGGTNTFTYTIQNDDFNIPPSFTMSQGIAANSTVVNNAGTVTTPEESSPIINIVNLITPETGQTIDIQVTASDPTLVDSVLLSTGGLPGAPGSIIGIGTLLGISSGTDITILPQLVEDANGSTTITITATDTGTTTFPGDDNTFQQSFILQVDPENDAPTIDPISNITLTGTGQEASILLTGISPGPTNENQDPPTITPTAQNITPGNNPIISNPIFTYTQGSNTQGTLRFTPLETGQAQIRLLLQDNGAPPESTDTFFIVTVNPGSQTPRVLPYITSFSATAPLIIKEAAQRNQSTTVQLTLEVNQINANETILLSSAGSTETVPITAIILTPTINVMGLGEIQITAKALRTNSITTSLQIREKGNLFTNRTTIGYQDLRAFINRFRSSQPSANPNFNEAMYNYILTEAQNRGLPPIQHMTNIAQTSLSTP